MASALNGRRPSAASSSHTTTSARNALPSRRISRCSQRPVAPPPGTGASSPSRARSKRSALDTLGKSVATCDSTDTSGGNANNAFHDGLLSRMRPFWMAATASVGCSSSAARRIEGGTPAASGAPIFVSRLSNRDKALRSSGDARRTRGGRGAPHLIVAPRFDAAKRTGRGECRPSPSWPCDIARIRRSAATGSPGRRLGRPPIGRAGRRTDR